MSPDHITPSMRSRSSVRSFCNSAQLGFVSAASLACVSWCGGRLHFQSSCRLRLLTAYSSRSSRETVRAVAV